MVPVVRSTTRVDVPSWSGRDIQAGFGWRESLPENYELRTDLGFALCTFLSLQPFLFDSCGLALFRNDSGLGNKVVSPHVRV